MKKKSNQQLADDKRAASNAKRKPAYPKDDGPLEARFDALFHGMQKATSKRGAAAAFAATPEELGRAAVAAAHPPLPRAQLKIVTRDYAAEVLTAIEENVEALVLARTHALHRVAAHLQLQASHVMVRALLRTRGVTIKSGAKAAEQTLMNLKVLDEEGLLPDSFIWHVYFLGRAVDEFGIGLDWSPVAEDEVQKSLRLHVEFLTKGCAEFDRFFPGVVGERIRQQIAALAGSKPNTEAEVGRLVRRAERTLAQIAPVPANELLKPARWALRWAAVDLGHALLVSRGIEVLTGAARDRAVSVGLVALEAQGHLASHGRARTFCRLLDAERQLGGPDLEQRLSEVAAETRTLSVLLRAVAEGLGDRPSKSLRAGVERAFAAVAKGRMQTKLLALKMESRRSGGKHK